MRRYQLSNFNMILPEASFLGGLHKFFWHDIIAKSNMVKPFSMLASVLWQQPGFLETEN
jgi:hypothetical protein